MKNYVFIQDNEIKIIGSLSFCLGYAAIKFKNLTGRDLSRALLIDGITEEIVTANTASELIERLKEHPKARIHFRSMNSAITTLSLPN